MYRVEIDFGEGHPTIRQVDTASELALLLEVIPGMAAFDTGATITVQKLEELPKNVIPLFKI